MYSPTRRIVVTLVLALAWVPALYVAWIVRLRFLKLFNEFDVHPDVVTMLMLRHLGWLCPVAALITIVLVAWRPATNMISASVVLSLAFLGLPLLLWLYHLDGLFWQLS